MRKNLMNKSSVVAVMLFLSVTRLMAAETYGNWPYYKDFTINTSSTGANVATDQHKFPLLIRLSAADSAIFNKAQSTGSDIRFSGVTAAGAIGTHFRYQRELWDKTNKAAAFWVQVDTVKGNGASQKIRIFWGSSTTADSSKSTAVFDTANGFQGVWHLNEGNGATISDATTNAYNGTPRGKGNGNNKPADTTGVIGRAKYFNGGSDSGAGQRDTSYYIIPSSAVNSKLGFQDTNGTYVISAWVNSDTIFAIPGRDRSIVDKGNNQYNLQMGSADPTNTPSVPWPNFGYVDVSKSWRATFSQASARMWRYVAAVHNGTHQYTFVDGIATDSTAKYYGTGSTARIFNDTVAIAALSTTKGACFKGYIDEVRIENVARSPDWIKLSFANQKIGSTMLTSGTPLISPPSNLTYWPDSVGYMITGAGITPDTATYSGIVDSFSFNPPTPPVGLFFDKKSGKVTGAPTVAQPPTSYTVIAYNTGGTDTVVLKITIVSTLTAPANLKYTTPVTYTIGSAITPNTPTSQGGAVSSYSISPSINSTGLSFSTGTGAISGTPTLAQAATIYTVTAANSAGSTTASVSITINPAIPSNLAYSTKNAVYTVGTLITQNTPSSQGGAVALYSISPQPTLIGLTFNLTTGVLSGTPSTAQVATLYTVIATNAGGLDTATFTITVNPAAPKISYAPIQAFINTAIAPDTPRSVGGAAISYQAPQLPANLKIDSTGIITGMLTTPGTYSVTVTATNTGGSSTATLAITASAKNTNPITITGSYVSATQVKISIGSYSNLSPVPPVDSIQILWKKNGYPDSISGTVIKTVSLSTLSKAGLQDTITLIFPSNTFLMSDSVGIGSAIWISNSSTVSPFANDAKIAMRDTTTPANGLAISGVWDSGTTIATIYIDSVSLKTIDTTKIQTISIWCGAANSGFFTSDQINNITSSIPAATILSSAKNGRFTAYDTSNFLEGQTPKTVYCAVRLTGKNSLNSPANYNSFSVGSAPLQNPLQKLTATRSPTDSTGSIILTWSPFGQYSVRIWYGVNQTLIIGNPTDPSLSVTPASLPTDSSVTVSNLQYGTTYYFGAQALINGTWTPVTAQSMASASTSGAVDTTHLKNTAKITGDSLDSATNVITVRWTVDTNGLWGKSLQIGIVYSLKGWPFDSTQVPLTSNIKSVKGTTGNDTLKLGESLVFDTTYYIGLWLRTTNGGWFRATDTTAMAKLKTLSFSWQAINYGDSVSAYAFNRKIALLDSVPNITTNTLDYIQPPANALQGFIQVSIGFNFSGTILGPAFWVGLHLDTVPPGYSPSQIRIYRYDSTSNSMMLDMNPQNLNMQNGYISVRTNHLSLPFIALIDTMSPIVTAMPTGIARDSALAGGQNVAISFAVSDNISNATYRLQYTVGGNSFGVDSSTHTDVIETKQIDTLRDTILGDYVSRDAGLRACIIASDGVHFDTTNLSCPAIRKGSSDLTSTFAGQWKPLYATALPRNPQVTYALRGLDKKGAWNYDQSQFRLFRWWADTGNANDTNKWVEYSKVPDSVFSFYPGRLMWIKSLGNSPIDFDTATTLSLKVPDTIVLQPSGWSDIALPYKFNIKIGDIVHATDTAGQCADTLQYYSWLQRNVTIAGKKTTQFYTAPLFIAGPLATDAAAPVADSLDSIQGSSLGQGMAAVYNPLTVPVKLVTPPTPASMSSITLSTALTKKKTTIKGWSIGISANTQSASPVNTVYCGFINGKGSSGYYPLPPTFSTITMSVLDDRKRRCAHLLTYGNLNKDGGVCFDLAVANTGDLPEVVTIDLAKYGAIPSGNFRIALFDPATGLMCDTAKAPSVLVAAGTSEYRKLVAGSPDYLAKVKAGGPVYHLALVGAYPNPFRRTLRIQYSVPGGNIGRIDFSIVDLSGREIWRKTLTSGALTAGPGVLAWNGKTKDNGVSASGLYVVRMRAFDAQGKTAVVFEKRITYLP